LNFLLCTTYPGSPAILKKQCANRGQAFGDGWGKCRRPTLRARLSRANEGEKKSMGGVGGGKEPVTPMRKKTG